MPENQPSKKMSDHPAVAAVKNAAVPKKSDGSVSWGQLTAGWGKITFALGVAAALWQGFSWIDDKLDSIENSSKKIKTIQDSLTAQDTRIAEHFNKLQKTLTKELGGRDDQIVELQKAIDAVRREMRARHGIFMDGYDAIEVSASKVPRQQRERIRDVVRATERARIRADNARPRAEPLQGLGTLK